MKTWKVKKREKGKAIHCHLHLLLLVPNNWKVTAKDHVAIEKGSAAEREAETGTVIDREIEVGAVTEIAVGRDVVAEKETAVVKRKEAGATKVAPSNVRRIAGEITIEIAGIQIGIVKRGKTETERVNQTENEINEVSETSLAKAKKARRLVTQQLILKSRKRMPFAPNWDWLLCDRNLCTFP